MPYDDATFDAVVSIATAEHVSDVDLFLKEANRVSKFISIHWYPAGDAARKVEILKRDIGHSHPCNIPDIPKKPFECIPFISIETHLLTLATIYPKLNVKNLHDFILNYGKEPYGYLMSLKKK